ncbi:MULTISPECIES: TlpA family protein disulfide reductase [unclassified Thalassolituus]|uniref:TlpA family protein disulfide reductase n=1 Tax=unclassified Thalassolituus TaxID=2624967 RepID=UPI0025DC95B4|nr:MULTISPECIES: TlpA disulfide reductase family protein [unclassified Thalassolituus]
MNSNASPAPSDTSQRRRSQWLRRLIELSVFILLFSLISMWLGRHMLDSETPAPTSQLTTLPTGDSNPLPASLHWPAQYERTLVYFFAPWCSVCRISMPGLNTLPTDDHSLRVIAIALDWQSRSEVQQFIADTGFNGEVFLGTADTAQAWQISGYPSYYVVDKQGLIVHSDRGVSTPPGLWLRTQL